MRCDEISARPDNLYTPLVGQWSEEKYMLLANYAQVFATSMKDKWEDRVYVDLFAGAAGENKGFHARGPLLANAGSLG